MFRSAKSFILAMLSVPVGWRMWMGLLMVVNLVIPLFLIGCPEARFTLSAFVLCFIIGWILFRMQGFTRLLGLMHFPWILLVMYLVGVVDQTPAHYFSGIWIRALIILNSVSLVLDVSDVFRYLFGERDSIIGL